MRQLLINHIVFPIWVRLTLFMGYNFCLWTPGNRTRLWTTRNRTGIHVIHLYDHPFHLTQSMREYLELS